MASAGAGEGSLEGVAVGVGEGVVGHDALDAHAALGEPLCGAAHEGGGLAGFGLEDLGVGEARVVVDADVEVLPAGASMPSPSPAEVSNGGSLCGSL